MNAQGTTGRYDATIRAVRNEVEPFLAHPPHNPDVFWSTIAWGIIRGIDGAVMDGTVPAGVAGRDEATRGRPAVTTTERDPMMEPTAPPVRGWDRGHWMQTYTGRAFYPMAPAADDIDIIDIAHALSLLCRYNGHTRRFYSVAEHCVHVSRTVPEKDALWGLLHDGTEAYVGDMVRPLKLHQPEYVKAEDRVMAAIAVRFGLTSTRMPDAVRDADNRILLTERARLLGTPPGDWMVSGEPLKVDIHAWPPAEAERQYLRRFVELTDELPPRVRGALADGRAARVTEAMRAARLWP